MLIAQIGADWLEYGALGLCGIMVVMNWLDRRAQGRTLDARNKRLDKLLTLNIRAWNRVADVFRDRKCVAGDSRVDNLGELDTDDPNGE